MSRNPKRPDRRFVPRFEQLDARQLMSAGAASANDASYAATDTDATTPAAQSSAAQWSESSSHVWYSGGTNDASAHYSDTNAGMGNTPSRPTTPAALPALLVAPAATMAGLASDAPPAATPVPVNAPPVPAAPPAQLPPPAALAQGEATPRQEPPAIALTVRTSEEAGLNQAAGPDVVTTAARVARQGVSPEAEALAAQSPGLAAGFLPTDPAVLEESVRQVLDRLDELAGPITTWGTEDRTSALWVFALAGTGAIGETLRRRYREQLPHWWATLTGSFRTSPIF
jgi:hypothetical protein